MNAEPTAEGPLTPFTGTIHIPIATMTGNPLSLNSRAHWGAKAAATKRWRSFAAMHADRYPELPYVDVTLTWVVSDRRRRDEDNLYPLLKALCDGLVDAGVVPDDTPDRMGKRCRIDYVPDEHPHMVLRVEYRPERAA